LHYQGLFFPILYLASRLLAANSSAHLIVNQVSKRPEGAVRPSFRQHGRHSAYSLHVIGYHCANFPRLSAAGISATVTGSQNPSLPQEIGMIHLQMLLGLTDCEAMLLLNQCSIIGRYCNIGLRGMMIIYMH